ncbi:aspartate/glutamate racemase family protein [Streptomyces niphimycinicus]|uniref:aspartate/glutamate racemase family protein n=1 Tax=Streptomyces niphimycinicus TaxID=2842201 RepID=UPI0027E3FF3C|nr:aspartate/glutamate racemase family protein [Streptomyces niphimycinicus]
MVIAGFGEPGREGAQELLDVPVLDIAESAAQMAMMLGHSYGVVTTLDRAVPQIRDRLLTAGLLGRCAGVRGTGLGVLERLLRGRRPVLLVLRTGHRRGDLRSEVRQGQGRRRDGPGADHLAGHHGWGLDPPGGGVKTCRTQRPMES